MDQSTTDRLNRVVAEFEAQFTVHDEIGYPSKTDKGNQTWSRCATGERYQTIVGLGQKDVVQAWLEDATAYAQEINGTHIWWRCRPAVEPPYGMVYSRFVITKDAEPEG
jgi:hypothetical protein